MTPTLVVLAAGAARRYGDLKQLAPVGLRGEALLEFGAYDAIASGFDEVVLVIRPEHEATFRERFDDGLGRATRLVYSFQTLEDEESSPSPVPRTKPWGTGHAVLAARDLVRGPFAVVNADDFYGRDAYRTMSRCLERFQSEGHGPLDRLRGAVMGYRVDQTLSPEGPVSRALLRRTPEERLLEVLELPSVERRRGSIRTRSLEGALGVIDPDARVSMNMWGFEDSLFEPLQRGFEDFRRRADAAEGEFMLPAFVNREIASDRATVEVLPTNGPWTGMTFEADRESTAQFLAERTERGEYPSPLWSHQASRR